MLHPTLSVSLLFGLTTFITIWFFYKASGNSRMALVIPLIWIGLQSFIGISGFYLNTDTIPPRFLILIGFPLALIIGLFVSPKGRKFLDGLDLPTLTLLHTIRIPVEIVLYLLFLAKMVPELMTFEGRNFDILSGISAPVVYYMTFKTKQLGKKGLMAWNLICLALLINIVANAVLSVPFRFQQFAFDQPNIAVLYFPIVWLPCCVVPLVLLSHLAALRQLTGFGEKAVI